MPASDPSNSTGQTIAVAIKLAKVCPTCGIVHGCIGRQGGASGQELAENHWTYQAMAKYSSDTTCGDGGYEQVTYP